MTFGFWFAVGKDDAVGATTQRTALVTLSSALNVALREEKIGRNPCSTVPTPKPKRPEVAVLDGQQVMQLLGAARDVQERALDHHRDAAGRDPRVDVGRLGLRRRNGVRPRDAHRRPRRQARAFRTEDHEVAARDLSPGAGAQSAPCTPGGAPG